MSTRVCASLKHHHCGPSVPVSLCPHDTRPPQPLGCRDSCMGARGGGFPGAGGRSVAAATSWGSSAHLPPSLSRCRPPAHSSLSPSPSPLPWLPHCPVPPVLPCPPCSAPAAPPFPGSLVHPHPPRGPSVPPSAPAARRMARPAAAAAGTAPSPHPTASPGPGGLPGDSVRAPMAAVSQPEPSPGADPCAGTEGSADGPRGLRGGSWPGGPTLEPT